MARGARAAVEEGKPDLIAFVCPNCEQPRVFNVVDRRVRYLEEIGEPEEFTYATCPRCALPLLLRRDYDFDENGFDSSSYIREFPPETRRLAFDVPRHVRHSYDEAVRCEGAQSWTAVAVMVGRALEAICVDFDKSSRSIADGLQRMHVAGAISQELKDWGDGLRIVRNEGAHAGDRVQARDARYALDFLQALMEILFDLRSKFADWQAARAARTTRGAPSTSVRSDSEQSELAGEESGRAPASS